MASDVVDELLDSEGLSREGPADGFLAAVNVSLDFLRTRFPRYADFLVQRTGQSFASGFDSLNEVDRLPAIFLPVLKSYQFPLPSDLLIVQRLTSSGTTGQPSVIPLDEPSWRRRVRAMLAGYRALGLLDGETGPGELTALAFLMDPATTHMAGSLVIDAVLRSVPRIRTVHYLARMGASGPQFTLHEAGKILAETAQRGPVVLVGYPALIAAAIAALARGGLSSLPLRPGSRILTGGGWKSFLAGVSLDQEEFRRQACTFFGLPGDAIRDMFGLSECPAVFIQCEKERYHVPAWCWAQAIDPEIGREVPLGQEGLLRLTTPLTTSYPMLRILTTDRVTLGRGCPCGRPARYLIPRGRVSAARFETCAMRIGQAVV
jgi:phenylacetate-coenzyme A ligase PaaK-like adenylate-forming protein